MYNPQDVATKIKFVAKSKSIKINQLLEDIDLNYNTMSNMRASMPRADNLAKIADYLNCSVDYLLGRTDNPIKTVSSNDFSNSTITNSTVGTNSAKITVHNTEKSELSEQAAELLRVFKNLNVREQTKLLSFAFELESQNLNEDK